MEKTNISERLRRDKWHFNFDEFQETLEKSKKECPHLQKINELFFMLACTAASLSKIPSFFDEDAYISDKYSQSLVFHCFLELLRSSSCTIFLSGCGLYKNAYHNIRHVLESIVQTLYIDTRHPYVDFPTKIEILKEVEDLPQYRGVQLLKALEIDYKEEIMKEHIKINEEYKNLSKKVHFTYRQLLVTSKDFMESSLRSTKADCNEVSNIYYSMRTVYDTFFFLFLIYFPEIRKPLSENIEFIETAKNHNLTLLLKVLWI